MMPRIKPLLVLCAALLTVTPAASADVNSDMNQFFNKLGFASNTTQPGVWQGQAAGYAYGGSLYARTQVKNVQLISMTLPDINAGCGGIDAYLGSFSFINGEQLQRFVKQIMSNAAGYFFDLALQTTVPEIKTAKDFLQKMASDINSMNLSSCQAAQGILLMALWGPLSGTSYGIAGLLMLAVSHRLYRAEDRTERLVLVACLLTVIPALNLATSDTAAVAGLVMTVLTVGLVSCAGKSLPRFWPGDFFPTFYACHLAVLGVLAL